MKPIKELELDCITYAAQLDQEHIHHSEPVGLGDIKAVHDNAWMFDYVSPNTQQPIYVLEVAGSYAGDAYISRCFLFEHPFEPEEAVDFLESYAAKRESERHIESEMRNLRRFPEEEWNYGGLTEITRNEYDEAVRRLKNGKNQVVSSIVSGDKIMIWHTGYGILTIETKEERAHAESGRNFVKLTFGGNAPDIMLPAEQEVFVLAANISYYLSLAWYAASYAAEGQRHFEQGVHDIKTTDGEQFDLSLAGGWTPKHAEHLRYARGYYQSALRDLEKTKEIDGLGMWEQIDAVNKMLAEIETYLPAAEAVEREANKEAMKEWDIFAE